MNNTSPIIIFCYRRNIEKLVDSLLKNKDSEHSNLFVFSDGYKSDKDKEDVLFVRKSLKKIKGFKSIKIYESEMNKGCAKSIIDGVNLIINNFGKAIVLEDDLIVSRYFLNFMNQALDFYQDDKKIWSISGYSPPLLSLKNYERDLYLSVRSSSWGWATWLNRWNKVDWAIKNFNHLKKDKNKINNFEIGGNDLFKLLELQYFGKIDAWDVRWCYSQFLYSAYSITPKISMTQNYGFGDKYSTHNKSKTSKWEVDLSEKPINPHKVFINNKILSDFKKFYDLSIYFNIKYFLKKLIGKKQ
jgi:hypothetical protein